jgi:hypothetical protein
MSGLISPPAIDPGKAQRARPVKIVRPAQQLSQATAT